MTPALEVTGVVKSFGGLRALDQVSLSIGTGDVLGLIGPNGSGKSTLVNAISGFSRPDAGSIALAGERIDSLGPVDIRRLGVARTFQNLRLIDQLSVLDNVLVGLHLFFSRGRAIYMQWLPEALGLPRSRRARRDATRHAMTALEHLGLADRCHERVSALSYGERKRLELARAIALPPRVLLLDEPTAGLEPEEAETLMGRIVELARTDVECSILLIEHRLPLIAGLCDRIVVMDSGRTVADGPADVVASDPEVLRLYVGEEDHDVARS